MWRHDALTTHTTCSPDSVRKVKSVDAFRDKPSLSPLTTTLSSTTAKLSSKHNIDQQQLLDAQDAVPQQPFVIVVSGAPNVGKSALIKLAHHKLRVAETANSNDQRAVHTLTLEDMTYPIQLVELSIDKFDTTLDPLQLPKDVPKVDGGLICFDLTNKDSMDCLPDLLNLFHSLQIPLFLLGLKSDLTVLRQVDAHLATNLGKLFNTPFSEINSFSLHCSRRLIEICANIVLSCTAKRQDIDMDKMKPTSDWIVNKQFSTKNPLTLRERRLAGEPIIRIGTKGNNSPFTKPPPLTNGHGKHSPKKSPTFCTTSSPPDHQRCYPVDAMRSPRPRASKSMPLSTRNRNDFLTNGDRTPNTSLSSNRLSPTFPSHHPTPGFVYAPTQSTFDTSPIPNAPSPSFKPLPNLPTPPQPSVSEQYSHIDSINNLKSATSMNNFKRNKRSSKDSG
ncbi:hypothetical protein BGW37DRAFT_21809 [Umbelopsis sp. PMI_123]|nr:hypothetical protein BGW37DRAFT_21809 [Umbelopsis sp. PMI_123]